MLYSGRILFFPELNNKLVLGFQEYESFVHYQDTKKTHEITFEITTIIIPGFQYTYTYFFLFYFICHTIIT